MIDYSIPHHRLFIDNQNNKRKKRKEAEEEKEEDLLVQNAFHAIRGLVNFCVISGLFWCNIVYCMSVLSLHNCTYKLASLSFNIQFNEYTEITHGLCNSSLACSLPEWCYRGGAMGFWLE